MEPINEIAGDAASRRCTGRHKKSMPILSFSCQNQPRTFLRSHLVLMVFSAVLEARVVAVVEGLLMTGEQVASRAGPKTGLGAAITVGQLCISRSSALRSTILPV